MTALLVVLASLCAVLAVPAWAWWYRAAMRSRAKRALEKAHQRRRRDESRASRVVQDMALKRAAKKRRAEMLRRMLSPPEDT